MTTDAPPLEVPHQQNDALRHFIADLHQAPDAPDLYTRYLRELGHERFRPVQRDIVAAILAGRRPLAILGIVSKRPVSGG